MALHTLFSCWSKESTGSGVLTIHIATHPPSLNSNFTKLKQPAMCLLCYVLVLLAVLFVTNSEATSTIKNPDQNDGSELMESDIIALTRFLAVDNGAKRQLRGAPSADGADLSADDEERGIQVPASVTKLLKTLSTKATKLKDSTYNNAFKMLFKYNVTPEELVTKIPAAFRARLKNFIEKYDTYYKTRRWAIVPV